MKVGSLKLLFRQDEQSHSLFLSDYSSLAESTASSSFTYKLEKNARKLARDSELIIMKKRQKWRREARSTDLTVDFSAEYFSIAFSYSAFNSAALSTYGFFSWSHHVKIKYYASHLKSMSMSSR